MNIFAIFLLLIIVFLLYKIELNIYFKLDNFESYFKIRILRKEIKRKGSLLVRKKKYVLKNVITKFIEKKIIKKEDLKLLLNCFEIEKLNINMIIGLIYLYPTILSIPLASTAFEYVKTLRFKEFKNYKYIVIPAYDKLCLQLEVDTVIRIRILDLLKYSFKIGIKSLKMLPF